MNSTDGRLPTERAVGFLNRVRGLKTATLPFASKYRWSLRFIGLPFLAFAVYFGLIASDQYVSDAYLIVRQDSLVQAPQLDLGALVGNTNSAQKADALLLKAFVESKDMLAYLEKDHGFRQHYQSGEIDAISRLSQDASLESLYNYYSGKIRVRIDSESSIVHVEVRAFSSQYANELLRAIATRSEVFVNEIGQALAREQMAFIQRELDRSHQRMRDANEKLLGFQNESDLLSPDSEMQAIAQVVATLEADLAQQRTEMHRLRSYLTAEAPEVVSLRGRIVALERQIKQERQKQVGGGKKALNVLTVEYQEAQMAVKLATDIYQSTLAALEGVRLDASRKVKYLVTVSAPSLPESASYPRRLYTLLTVLVVLIALYGIGKLIVATIEDHKE